MSGQTTVSEYYSVSCRPFDGPGDGALLSAVRGEYFSGGKTVKGTAGAVENGSAVRVRYRVGKGVFQWRKSCGRTALQESFPLEGGGWRLVSHDLQGKLVSAATFDGSLRWLQTAYYDGGPMEPAAVLARRGDGVTMLERDPQTGRYVRRSLLPCAAEPGTAAQSYIDGRAGEPRVLAQTDAGTFCFCPAQERELRLSLRGEIAGKEVSLTPDWPREEDARLDFRVMENDGQALRAAALQKKPEEKPVQEESSAPGPEAPSAPAAEDYAADHEIYLSDVPPSGRYAVAAKGLSGGVIHAAGLKSCDAPRGNPPSCALIPAKRIVVSSMESYQYFGKLLNGLREGRGRTQMLDGRTAYEGGYRDDMRDGFGVYYYKSGKLCYAGGWRRNLRNGMGVAFGSKDGSIFVGRWENGVATGNGSAFDLDGNLIYTGGWKDGRRHGRGTEYRGGRIVRVGEWKDGRFCSGYSRVGGPGEGPGA